MPPDSQKQTESVDAEPKERILEAAVELFSRKGFAGAGVREIARAANVNLAMVSYYYGSKRGLLEAIFELTFRNYARVIGATLELRGASLDQRVRRFFREAVAVGRRNPRLIRITLTELHHEDEKIAELKARRVRELLLPAFQALVGEASDGAPLDRRMITRIGPSMIGMVAFHFLTAPVFSHATGERLDDAFYEGFADQLADLALTGLRGMLAERATNKETR